MSTCQLTPVRGLACSSSLSTRPLFQPKNLEKAIRTIFSAHPRVCDFDDSGRHLALKQLEHLRRRRAVLAVEGCDLERKLAVASGREYISARIDERLEATLVLAADDAEAVQTKNDVHECVLVALHGEVAPGRAQLEDVARVEVLQVKLALDDLARVRDRVRVRVRVRIRVRVRVMPLLTMSGMSGPHDSLHAANSILHQPRLRHDEKSHMVSVRFECATGGTSTHIIEQRSTYAGMLSTAALRSSIMPLIQKVTRRPSSRRSTSRP